MRKLKKTIEELTILDLQTCSVWQYVNDDSKGEIVVKSVSKLPVKSLSGKLVGSEVVLASGSKRWALIGNVEVNNPRLTKHFLTLSIVDHDEWFTLARYHDFDFLEKGPKALARFLKLKLDQVFPISYDIASYSMGEREALTGQILKEPTERLSRAEIIALAVP